MNNFFIDIQLFIPLFIIFHQDPPLCREGSVNGWSTPQSPSTPVTPGSAGCGKNQVPFCFYSSLERSDSNSSNRVSTPTKQGSDKTGVHQEDEGMEGDGAAAENAEERSATPSNSILASASCEATPSGLDSSSNSIRSRNSTIDCDSPSANDSVFEKDGDSSLISENSNTGFEDQTPSRKAAVKTGSTAIRRRPGRRMNKARVKVEVVFG